ncbi:ABC transporter permease [Pedobacter deserti]|uniref:ABC transporter permease n=1 Tax=Pedobacter deserti TaxID=2817382 RepID=UPI00210E34DB|nr:FtsX-like permease family protein [Pedobacter sp. SYSU D00382]
MPADRIIKRQSAGIAWLMTMAWRDSRRNRSRLLLFVAAIVLGIAALVAVYSFRDNLTKDIERQALELTGADLVLDGNAAPGKGTKALMDTLGSDRSFERSFASMVYFIKDGGSRLVQIRALEGKYPYYGAIETIPAHAAADFQDSTKSALVDKTLMLQYNAVVGDSIKVGALNFVIKGALEKVPGQTGVSSTVAPVVYIPLRFLQATGLTEIGSRITYKYYIKLDNPEEAEQLVKELKPDLDKYGLDAETVASRKAETGRSFKDVNRFMALSGFVALLLGCIGVGSAIHVYIREKLGAIATLRCMGVKSSEAFQIFLIQIGFIGVLSAVIGCLLGTLLQFILPAVLKDFLPVELHMQLSWPAIWQGLLLGTVVSILFALPSLLAVRHISPLNAIRMSYERKSPGADPFVWLVYVVILGFIFWFTYLQMGGWLEAVIFTFGISLAFLLLYTLSKLLMWLLRKLLPQSFSYLWRQGFANLYRPGNQTMVLTVSIGLSAAFIGLLFLVQAILIKRVTVAAGDSQPNMVLFDIQSEQKEPVAQLTRAHRLPVMNQVPIVTLRIDEINGKTAADLSVSDSLPGKKPGGREPSERAFSSELRVTFQSKLTEAERITKGVWAGVADSIPRVSFEQNYARRIQVDVGDTVVFNVQGVLVRTIVGSLREVNWARMQTNFRVVFPQGVLEDAPQFHVLMTRVPTSERSAAYQAAVVRAFPNVSVIDLKLILQVLDDLLSKISFVIRFMAGFSMATGWIVLISSVLTSKAQRTKESLLLRTLGASSRQILAITAVEYLFLGIVATGAGMFLALCGSWALAVYVFDAAFEPSGTVIAAFFFIITSIVVITGLVSSRAALKR